ncbi:hypothetical protein GUITHDRAFT_142237 [Guillardia theta CCMP2712]|uniref:RING-type domain-containing protein n=1 Tax=Guillardia theta (strain CCMP2712) TaxID=905079 RepID=L1IXS1_GUITC|nr:hypothetical protein GUITHDRAFT_142237 [Guillardia theta CCMP2712]EKX41073.1 hypothetical protein GUITHDRAFT_142237 [Guillardia theta CCMP2712]|eukprot:XP_005828053.1 hypothetical protein GUITHDRAFT_142237 [Guillardia theta CCMP2712]
MALRVRAILLPAPAIAGLQAAREERSRFFEHEVEKARNRDEKRRREREKIDDELFDECPVCKKDFVEPVMTGCGHQFCLECISSDFDQCPVCGVEIRGDFTPVEDGAHQEDVRETV